MSFFANAYAAAAPEATNPLMSYLPLVAILVLFYFMLIRPQQKRAKELKAMLAGLTKGDEVITNSGIVGSIIKLDERYLTLEIANSVEILIQRNAIAGKLEKGTIKNQR